MPSVALGDAEEGSVVEALHQVQPHDFSVELLHPVQVGDTFALVLRLPAGAYALAAGRVVFVLDEPDRRGFGYGTLPGHPEQGEEAFVVVRRGDRMYFEITAFSRPRHPLARFAKPVSRLLQRQTTRRYFAAMHAVVSAGPLPPPGR